MVVEPDPSQFADPSKFDLAMKAVVPQGVEHFEKRLKIASDGTLPAFGSAADRCELEKAGIKAPASIREQTSEADYILFVGVENAPEATWLAYAIPCAYSKHSDLVSRSNQSR